MFEVDEASDSRKRSLSRKTLIGLRQASPVRSLASLAAYGTRYGSSADASAEPRIEGYVGKVTPEGPIIGSVQASQASHQGVERSSNQDQAQAAGSSTGSSTPLTRLWSKRAPSAKRSNTRNDRDTGASLPEIDLESKLQRKTLGEQICKAPVVPVGVRTYPNYVIDDVQRILAGVHVFVRRADPLPEMRTGLRPILFSTHDNPGAKISVAEVPGVGPVEGAHSVARLLLPRLQSSVTRRSETK